MKLVLHFGRVSHTQVFRNWKVSRGQWLPFGNMRNRTSNFGFVFARLFLLIDNDFKHWSIIFAQILGGFSFIAQKVAQKVKYRPYIDAPIAQYRTTDYVAVDLDYWLHFQSDSKLWKYRPYTFMTLNSTWRLSVYKHVNMDSTRVQCIPGYKQVVIKVAM